MESLARGQIGELAKDTRCFRVTWRIANIMSLPKEVDAHYSSPHFYFLNSRWFLTIYPNGRTKHESEEHVGIYLERSGEDPPVSVYFVVSVKTKNDKEEFHRFAKYTFSQMESSWGQPKFLTRFNRVGRPDSKELVSCALTVVCTLWADVEDQRLISRETQTEEESLAPRNTKGGTILLKHFQDFLLTDKDHDVTLKVKDHEFRAHKCILRARSPVFAAMFANGMSENERGEVCVEDCDPKAFGEFLKYVYVGKFENSSPATAAGLYYIADKYDFPHLKETCVEFLKASLTANVIADVILLAMKHGEDELLECAMKFFAKYMMEIFMTVEWQRFITSNPILANELAIKALKISRENTK